MRARDYQIKAVQAVEQGWLQGYRRQLLCMPTGTGKTVVMAHIIKRNLPKRTMFIAHRQELIWQAMDKIQAVTGLHVDVEMGEHKTTREGGLFNLRAPVIVSTVQTHTAGGDGGGRIGKFDPEDFSILMFDEAHRSTAPAYMRIADYYMNNPKLNVLGVTATPNRTDKQALGQFYDYTAFNYELYNRDPKKPSAIRDGWLVPIEQQFVTIESLDFTSVKTQAGDLNQTDLDAVMTAEKNLYGVADATLKIAGDKQGLGFASSVKHAHILSNMFNRYRSGMSAYVSAKTDKDERRHIIEDFAEGKLQWLWNCGVFTEGFDESSVEVIAQARPTTSELLYTQMAGRGTRPHASLAHILGNVPAAVLRRLLIARSPKPSCLIIDFVGNSGKHKLISSVDILGGEYSKEVLKQAKLFARQAGKPLRMDQVLEDEEKRAEEIKKSQVEQAVRKANLKFPAKFKVQKVDPFDAMQVRPVVPTGRDTSSTLTEKQRAKLRQAGYNPDKIKDSDAKRLLGKIIDRWRKKKGTVKQAETLHRLGWTQAAADDMTFNQASAAIDAAQRNGWKKPDNYQHPPSTDTEQPF